MSPSAKQPDVCLDTITHLSAPLHETSSLSPLVQLLTLAYQVKRPPPATQERLTTLLNTLSPQNSTSTTTDDVPRIRIGSFIRFLGPVLNGFAGMAEFESAVGAFSKPGEFREFWDLDDKNLITEFVSDGGSQRMVTGSDVVFLERFVEDKGKRVALTGKQGMLVLVPAEAQVGDEVWDVPGADGVVVRRGDGEEARNVGSAYVDAAAS